MSLSCCVATNDSPWSFPLRLISVYRVVSALSIAPGMDFRKIHDLADRPFTQQGKQDDGDGAL